MNLRDRNLIERILLHDRKALVSFYHTYKPKLEVFISSRVGDPQDAEEILQDTLFAFLEKIRDFEGKASIRTFLQSIAHNKVVDYYRRRKRRQQAFSELPQLEAILATLRTPEDEFDAKVLRDKVARALSGILPKYKLALLSKYQDEKTVAEIARALAVTVKGAESVLFRARKAFADVFVSL